MSKQERDIHGRFLPKHWHWYYVGDGKDVLAISYDDAISKINWWLSYPIEVEWVRTHA